MRGGRSGQKEETEAFSRRHRGERNGAGAHWHPSAYTSGSRSEETETGETQADAERVAKARLDHPGRTSAALGYRRLRMSVSS